MDRRVLAAIVLSLLVQLGAAGGLWMNDLVPTALAVATQENQSPATPSSEAAPAPTTPAARIPLLQSITRVIVFLAIYSLVGTMVGKALVSDFQWTPGDTRETVTFAIAIVVSYTLSAALSLTPSIGPYLGNLGIAHAGRGSGTEFVLGAALYWTTVVVFVVLVFQLASVVTQNPYRPAVRMFVLLLSIAVGQLIHTRLLNVIGLPRPDRDGFAAFFTGTIGSLNVPDISSNGGLVQLLFRPVHALIAYVDSTIHDVGVTVVLTALLLYFVYSILTYGMRRAIRSYQQELAWVHATHSGSPDALRSALARMQERNVLGCGSLVVLNAVKILFLVAVYYFFASTPDFRNIQSVFPITDLASPPRGFVILSLAGLSVVAQSLLQANARAPLPTRFFGSLVLAAIVAACAYFAPAGMVLVLTTMTVADTLQSLYESRLPRESWSASLIPALVVIPLAVAFIPRGAPTEPQPQVMAEKAVADPAAPIESSARVPPGEVKSEVVKPEVKPEATPEVKADPGAALSDRVAELTQKSDFKQALDLIDAQLVEHPTNEQFTTVKVRTLEEYGVKQLNDLQKAAAVTTLEEAHRLDPKNESVAARLATIYVEAGEEDLRGACVRNEPSPFAPVLATMSVGDVLTRRAADPSPGWLPVDAGTDASGWILASLVEETPSSSSIQVKRTMAREEVYKALTAAMELSPTVRNRVLWIKYKMLLVPAGLLLAVIYVGWRKFAGL